MESGAADPIFPAAHVREAIAVLETVYAEWGAEQQFSYDIHSGGHEISGRRSILWLAEKLMW
ncbi:hypothetical protein D3C75_235650 [compost metagenome]